MSSDSGAKESPKAYQAYLDYRDLGAGRSLQKLVEKRRQSGGKTTVRLRTLEEWSSKFGWQDRIKQYQAEEAAEQAEKKRKRREEMEERHARESQEEQEIARKHIKASVSMAKDGKEIYGRISLPAVQLLKNSREDERKALGVEDSEGLAVEVNTSEDNVQVIVYYPQSKDKEA